MSPCTGPSRIRRPPRGGGFTLIESIAVMVMLVILAAVTVPALTGLGATRSAMAGRHLRRDLTFARQHAVATGTITWVRFDTTGNTAWELRAEDAASPGKAAAVLLADPSTGATYRQDLNAGSFAGVTIQSAVFTGDDTNTYADVGFDWLGRPLTNDAVNLSGTGVVTLTGSNVVNVFADTGYAKYVGP